MALLFIEGYEGYASITQMLQSTIGPVKWADTSFCIVNNATYRTAQVTAANSRSMQVSGFNTTMYSTLSIPSKTEVIVGTGFFATDARATNIGAIIVGGTSFASQGVGLFIDFNTGVVTVGIPNGSGQRASTLGTTTGSYSPNSWIYFEMRVKLHATAGEVEVWQNGVQTGLFTGINTATGGIANYKIIGFGCMATGVTTYNAYYDDMYVADTTGTVNNTFLGPVSVYSLVPTANGSTTQLTANGVAQNWDAVNDPTADDATTYVSTAVTGQKDYYLFQALPVSVTAVSGVMLKTRSTLGASGTRKLQMNLKNGASVISSALKSLSFGSWLWEYFVSDTSPDGTAWDPTKVNNTEGGVEAE